MPQYALTSIAAIRAANRDAGQHFFDVPTLRFFNSRIGTRIWPQPDGSALFITSEQNPGHPRRYTVRICWPDSGHVDSISEFQQFASVQTAVRWAQRWTNAAHIRYVDALLGKEAETV